MKIEIYTRLNFSFPVTQKQVAVLSSLSERHYDSVCRGLTSKAGDDRVNGLLTIWQHHLDHTPSGSETIVTATLRELDTVLKCMEMSNPLQSADEQTVVRELRDAYQGAMVLGSIQQKHWVASYSRD